MTYPFFFSFGIHNIYIPFFIRKQISAGGPRFKDFLLDKTMAYTCVVNNCSNGPYWLKNWEKLLVNMDAFIPTTNVAVTPFQANTRI